jgi:glutathione S-transferase
MKLYYAETMNPRKVCALAKFLGLPVEFVRVDLRKGEHRTPEFLAMNPNGKVPVLVDGDLVLWESTAIMVHLAVKARSDLWPSDAAGQVEVLRWLCWDLTHFSRHGATLYFENVIKRYIGRGEAEPSAVEEATGFFRHFAAVLDANLAKRDFVAGSKLSVADFSVGVLLPWAKDIHLPIEDFPHVVRWHERMMALPGWREPFPAPLPAVA